MDKDIEHFIAYCEHCNLADKGRKPYYTLPVNQIPYLFSPLTKLSLDIHGPILEAPHNYRYLLVFVVLHSKSPEVLATASITISAVIEFLSDCIARFGLLKEIIMENRKQFTSADFDGFLHSYNIKQCRTAFYYSQANGEVERFNRTLAERLSVALAIGQSVPPALSAIFATYRSKTQHATGLLPAELYHGRAVRLPLNTISKQYSRKSVQFNPTPRVTKYHRDKSEYADTDRHA